MGDNFDFEKSRFTNDFKMLDNWTRARTERFRTQIPAKTAQLIDLLAANPGRIFNSADLVEILDLESEYSLSGLLSHVTHAAKRADIDQSEEGSWFVCWKVTIHHHGVSAQWFRFKIVCDDVPISSSLPQRAIRPASREREAFPRE